MRPAPSALAARDGPSYLTHHHAATISDHHYKQLKSFNFPQLLLGDNSACVVLRCAVVRGNEAALGKWTNA
jgi:hypothetical protein